jgi:hypothetical protein
MSMLYIMKTDVRESGLFNYQLKVAKNVVDEIGLTVDVVFARPNLSSISTRGQAPLEADLRPVRSTRLHPDNGHLQAL